AAPKHLPGVSGHEYSETHLLGLTQEFFPERLHFYLRDVLGYQYDVVNAVLAVDSDDVPDAVARAAAVANVRSSPDFGSIAIAFKRIRNILRQAAEKGYSVSQNPTSELLVEDAERQLHDVAIWTALARYMLA